MGGRDGVYGSDDVSKHRVATMSGTVVGEGDTVAEAMLAAAMVRHPGLTVQVPPGERVADVVADVRKSIRRAFDVDADEGEGDGDG